jgi:hypothetical protein
MYLSLQNKFLTREQRASENPQSRRERGRYSKELAVVTHLFASDCINLCITINKKQCFENGFLSYFSVMPISLRSHLLSSQVALWITKVMAYIYLIRIDGASRESR